MKRISLITLLALFFVSCGNKGEKSNDQESDNQELSTEEEAILATEISEEIQTDTEELKKATEEDLQEIDSLLSDF